MDVKLRRLERLKHEDPEAWLRNLIRAGKLGPTNQAVFGMLGYQPMINILGGAQRPDKTKTQYHYWFKGRWYDEKIVVAQYSYGTYRPRINRLYFHIQRVVWMKMILASLSHEEKWLIPLENRQWLLKELLLEL